MHNYSELLEYFNEQLKQQNFEGRPAELYEPIHYTMQLGGKRLRPVLLMMSCEMSGGKKEDGAQAAMAFEMFHNFTLLHDDIMDKAPIRRGQPSVYKKWNQNIAILSGDTMLALAYRILINSGLQENLQALLDLFTETAIGVCEGQQYDMNFESNHVELPQYMEMIRLKTAILLAACMKAGAIIGGADKNKQQTIYRCGESMGIAFQLKDDLLDTYADEHKFGKKTGKDIEENKKTFLYLKALELSDPEQREKLLALYAPEANFTPGEKVQQTKAIFDKLNIRKHTQNLIEKYSNEAISLLNDISVNEENKVELKKTIEEMLHREW